MPRIILSLSLITLVAGTITFGAANAFFSDTESSVANIFTAGAIDLQIDNESYYNGVFNEGTSWEQTDLTIEKFFNFLDLKPDDAGEDTISIHVDTNDAYLCANVTLTSNDDNGINEPESEVDQTDGPGNGELAGLVNFLWWADDGDNVLEDDEEVISMGNFGQLGAGNTYPLTLADSDNNVWTGSGPVAGDTTVYLGKAWCFGTLGTAPIEQDGGDQGRSPAGQNGGTQTPGEPEDGGLTCNGTLLGNESQTDSLTADVTFEAVQARNNPNFMCEKNCTIVEQPQNILENYSFETPEVNHVAKWETFQTPVDGWIIEWREDVPATFGSQTRPALGYLELHENVLGSAYEGDQYSELDSDWGGPNNNGTGEPASITMYQDIPTVIGRPYRITFAFAARPNTSAAENRVEVKWGGGAVYDTGFVSDNNAGIEWQLKSIDVVATTTSTRLQFTDLGTANSMGSFIDDIKLYSPVCE